MGVWETREAGFEKAHEIDEHLRFRSLARRNKMLGLWAAEKLGMSGEAADRYASALVEAQVGRDDDDALGQWLATQLANVQPSVSAHRIHRKIGETTAIAAREIFEGRYGANAR